MFTDCLRRAVTEQLFGTAVPRSDDALQCNGDYRVVRRINDRREKGGCFVSFEVERYLGLAKQKASERFYHRKQPNLSFSEIGARRQSGHQMKLCALMWG
jgi:hypothetical protein